MIPRDSYEIIDTLIKQGRSFAIWRIPGEDRLHFRMQSAGSPCLLYDIKDLNERSGFVIAPFQVTAERPIVLIQPDCFEIPSDSDGISISFEGNSFFSREKSQSDSEGISKQSGWIKTNSLRMKSKSHPNPRRRNDTLTISPCLPALC